MTADTNTSVLPDNADFVSTHLTKEFFAEAIAAGIEGNRHDVNVVELHVSMGSNVGENFCSEIYRARVVYHRASMSPGVEVSLIVKAMPFTEARGPILDDLQVFDKEVSMYTDTLPRMAALLDGERLSARCLFARKHPVQIIVFEDLKADGYQMADRTAGLDEAHCACVLRKLGRFHAASVVLAESDESAMRPYDFGVVKPNANPSPVMDAVFVAGINAVTELMRDWPGFERIVGKFESLSVDFLRKMDVHCNATVPGYRVLNHGDLWVNNFMFRYAVDGRPIDVCFIDYQMSFYSSPGHDLNYFLNTSPNNQIREHRRDRLAEQYHEAFVDGLRQMRRSDTDRFTLAALHEEIVARELYGLFAAVGVLPLVLMTRGGDEDMSLDAMAGGDSTAEKIKKAVYGNPSYVTAIQALVRRFDEQGVLDRVPK